MATKIKTKKQIESATKELLMSAVQSAKQKQVQVSELKNGFYAFGGRGDVFSNTAHIAESGDGTHRTMCGIPMLSTNWVRINEVKIIGCPECLNKYNKIK